jgi:hypothetical protein
VQRLQEDSQPSKAAALSSLTGSLLGMDLACSATLELNHNLLQLLASLAGQPLDSTLEETPQLLQLLYKPAEQQQPKQQQVAVSRFRQLLRGGRAAVTDGLSEDAASTAGSSSGDEYDPYADESDLTSWESDDEQQQHRQRTPAAAAHQESDSNDAAGQLQPATSSVEPAVVLHRPASALPAPHQLQPGHAAPSRHQLLGRLAAARTAKLPGMWPARDCCFSEEYLALQLLRVLQGQQAHGFLLQAEQQAGPGPLVPDSRDTTPAMSPGALQLLLQEFAEAGSAARQLRRLAAQLTQSRGRAWLHSATAAEPQAAAGGASELGIAGVAVTSCLRAFGVALQQQLDMMGQQLAELQRAALEPAADCSSSSGSWSARQPGLRLLSVKQRTRPMVRRLQLLHETVGSVLQQLGGCPADASATLLDGLQEAASAAALTASGEQGVADAAALLHLLLCSCVPLVAALSQWLWSAEDGAAPDESQLAALAEGAASRRSSDDAGNAQLQQQQQAGISCCSEDFFIVKRAAVAATDDRFWHAAYGFSQRRAASGSNVSAGDGLGSAAPSTTSAGDAAPAGALVACPSFLLPLAGRIMTAGKSVRLLDYMEQEELRRTSFCSSSSSAKSGSSNGAAPGAAGMWLGAAAARGDVKPRSQMSRSSSSAGAALQHSGRQADRSSGIARQGSVRAAGISSNSGVTRPFGRSRSSSLAGAVSAGPAADGAPSASASAALSGRAQSHRRQWSTTGAAAAPAAACQQPGVVTSDLTKQVRLQLAVAAALAGRSEQQQLPPRFIAAAGQLLQRQQLPGAQLAAADTTPSKQSAAAAGSAGQLMWQVLQAAGRQMSQPCAHPSQAGQQRQQEHAAVSLRDALLASKAQRSALPPTTKSSTGTPVKQQQPQQKQQQQQPKEAEQAQLEQQVDQPQQQDPAPAQACDVDDTTDGVDTAAAGSPPVHVGESLAEEAGAADAADAGSPDVPRLLQWREQLEARLAVAGSCLQHMASWQQQQHGQVSTGRSDSSCAPAAVHQAGAGAGSLLLRSAGSVMPGSFSASLAGLWPLQQPLRTHRSAAAAIKQWGVASCGADEQQQQQQSLSWLTGNCPGEQLTWLLLDPPQSLPPLPQLLEQALLAPIQERVSGWPVGRRYVISIQTLRCHLSCVPA